MHMQHQLFFDPVHRRLHSLAVLNHDLITPCFISEVPNVHTGSLALLLGYPLIARLKLKIDDLCRSCLDLPALSVSEANDGPGY